MNQIFWSPLAKDSYAVLLRYIMDNFPLDAALKMDEKVERLLALLEQNEQLCPPSMNIPNVRRCVISKHLSLTYRILEKDIELIAFFDNRTDHAF